MSQSERAQSTEETLSWGENGPAPPNRDLTGVTLGDFQVERMLGRGGMGEVYLARQISLSRQVALKVLRPDLLTKETYLKRFEAEATAVAKLNHPNIVHVYTLGNVDGVRFIAMEYVQGTNLRDYLNKKGALDLPLAVSIMKQAGVAVGAAGEIGLVHRDIKPENLLITRKGQVKIADFGLCRDQDASHVHLTQPGVTMGTPLYMSPEQAQGKVCDHRSDLYSLGATFYHMLAGNPPFRGDTPIAIALKQLKDTPVSLTVHRPDVPPELDRLVLKLMAKQADDRYQSAAEMLRDLAKVREILQTATMPPVGSAEVGTFTGAAELPLRTSQPVSEPAASGATASSKTSIATGAIVGLASARLGTRWLVALVLVGLAAGAGCGWFARPTDLLAAGAFEPGLPGLWIAPEWSSIPRRPSAQAQFEYALLRAPREELEAAWVAVPGYFPKSRDWSVQAYVHLARHLLRRHDAERLKALGGEIARWSEAQTHEQDLAALIEAGVKGLNGDVEGVGRELETQVKPDTLADPALAELGIEVTVQAMDVASRSRSASSTAKLQEARRKMTLALFRLQQQVRGRSRPR